MAGIITDVSEDIKKLQELKNEIESVKKSLKSIDIRVNLDIKENLEAQLKSLMGQYNNLAQKIGETEGKIMLSIKHINEATEKIINSQEKLSSSAKGISGVSNTGTTDTSIEAEGVKAQAKAYEELKKAIEEIDGVRSNNITRMLREQEQMKQYQKELKDLMAAPKTVDSNKRISELIENIERSKIAIAELRQAVKKDIKLEMAAPGSVDALAQSLSRMKDVWKSLSPEELESPFGKELTASIQQADEKIKELSGTIGEHQRNVGNYASGFKNIRTEQRELTYELAQLTIAYRNMSAAEKSSAAGKEMEKKIADLTNKAATLRDAMADVNRSVSVRASDTSNFSSISEGINLIISGFGAATGAAKMLGLSEEDLLEVQTKLQAAYVAGNALVRIQNTLQKESALMRGVEVLQTKAATTAINIKTAAEGKGVIVTKAATIAQAAFNAVANANPYVLLATAILSVVGALWAFSKGSSEVKKNAEEFNKSVADTASKSIAKVEELSIKYNRLGDNLKAKESFIRENKKAFQELGVAIQSVLDAENLLVEYKDKFIKAQIEKAKASIYLTTTQDKIKELIKAEEEYNAMPEKKSMYIQTSSFGSGYYKEVDNIEKINKKKEIDTLKTQITGLYEDAAKAESEGGKILEEAGISTMEQYADGSIKAINKAISEKRELLEKLAIGSDEYNRLSKEIEDLQKKLPSSKQNKSNKEEDKLLKQQEQLAEQLLSLRRKNQQDEINLMEEGSEKKIAQIKVDFESQKQTIEKQAKDLAKANKEAGVANLNKNGLTQEQQEEINKAIALNVQSMNKSITDLYKSPIEQYQSYTDERIAIEKKFNDDIALLQEARRKAEEKSDADEIEKIDRSIAKATAEKGKSLMKHDFDVLKQSPEYIRAFEDLKNTSSETLNSLLNQLENAKQVAAETLNPEDLREYTTTIQEIMDELDARNPFKALADRQKELAEAERELAEAKRQLDAVNRGERIVTGVNTYLSAADALNKYNAAKDKHQKANNNFIKAEKTAREKVDELAFAIRGVGDAIGGQAGEIISLMGDVASFATGTIDGITKVTQTGANAISAVEKASVILGIISTAIQLLQKISDLGSNKAFRQYEAYAEKVKEINALTNAVNEYRIAALEAQQAEANWFSTDNLRNLRDYKALHDEVAKAYVDKAMESQAIYQNQSGGGWLTGAFNWVMGNLSTLSWWDKWKNIWGQGDYDKGMTAAVNNLRIETRKRSKGFLGTGIGGKSQKTEDLVTWARNQGLGELFDDENLINKELAQSLIDNYGNKLVGQTKETLEALIELREQYDEYLNQLHEYVSSLYAPLVDNFVDSLWDWLDNGKDALDSFKDYASSTFRDIVSDMMRTIVLDKVVGTFSDDIAALYEEYAKGAIDETELMKKISERTSGLIDNYQQNIPALQNIMDEINGYLQDAGIDLKKPESTSQQKATAGGFETMSQDTATELNGRFTALQIAGEEIKNQNEIQSQSLNLLTMKADTLLSIGSETRNIADETRDIIARSYIELVQISENTGNSAKYLKDIKDDIAEVKRNTSKL